MDVVADEFVEFIEHLIRSIDACDPDGEDVIDVETCPTERLEPLDEKPVRPVTMPRTWTPSPVSNKSRSSDDLEFESDFEMLDSSFVDTERMEQE